MANSSGECPVPDQSHLPARPTRFPHAFRDTPASVAGANRTRIPRDDRVAAPGDPPATRAPTHPPPVALKIFSRISHLDHPLTSPPNRIAFFFAASVCVRTSWTGCPSSTAPWSWSTRPFTSRYDTSTPSSTAEVRIGPVHPAPTAQPRVQNIHSNPKTNALEKRAGYRRLFEKISN